MTFRLDKVGEETAHMVFETLPFKRRPRTDYRNKRTYTPTVQAKEEADIARQWTEQCGTRWDSFEGAVKVYIEIARPLPKSYPARLDQSQDLNKPDIDNCTKAILDALNGIAYKDDKQVVELEVWKRPRQKSKAQVEVTVRIRYYIEQLED